MFTCFTKSWVLNNKGCQGVDINPMIEVFSNNIWTNDEEGPADCWNTIGTCCEKEKYLSRLIGIDIHVASLVITFGGMGKMSTFLLVLHFPVCVTTLPVSIVFCDASRDVLPITALRSVFFFYWVKNNRIIHKRRTFSKNMKIPKFQLCGSVTVIFVDFFYPSI